MLAYELHLTAKQPNGLAEASITTARNVCNFAHSPILVPKLLNISQDLSLLLQSDKLEDAIRNVLHLVVLVFG